MKGVSDLFSRFSCAFLVVNSIRSLTKMMMTGTLELSLLADKDICANAG